MLPSRAHAASHAAAAASLASAPSELDALAVLVEIVTARMIAVPTKANRLSDFLFILLFSLIRHGDPGRYPCDFDVTNGYVQNLAGMFIDRGRSNRCVVIALFSGFKQKRETGVRRPVPSSASKVIQIVSTVRYQRGRQCELNHPVIALLFRLQ